MKRSRPSPAVPEPESYESHFEHTALFEFSKVINSSVNLQFILSHVLLTIMGKILSPKGMVVLAERKGTYTVHMVKGYGTDLIGRTMQIRRMPASLTMVRSIDEKRHPWARELKRLGVGMLLPMFTAEQPVGVLCFGNRLSKKPLHSKEKTYLLSLANISATAVEKSRQMEEIQQVNRKLDRKIQELNTLFELGKEFRGILDPDNVVRLLVFSLLGQIGVSRYVIALTRGPDMAIAASRLDGSAPQGEFLRSLSKIKTPALVEDLKLKRGEEIVEQLEAMGMVVIVPMTIQNEFKGLILLGEKLSREKFTQADLDLVSSLGNLAIISLENARLFNEAIEKQKMEDELQIAREIQKGLLPSVLPAIPSIEMAATNISSKQVGGDYYDVIHAGNGRYVLAIGDVSGKGTPASLLMANLQATIRALVPLQLPLSELTARVNDLMCQNTGSDKFVTFFWGVLDSKRRTLTYVNAGHNYPYLVHADGSSDRLERGGMILGVMAPPVPYEQEMLQLESGDMLVLFTDGVSEAMSKEGIEYGENRLEAVILGKRVAPADQIMEAIHSDILEFTRGAQQSDDITMMVVKVF